MCTLFSQLFRVRVVLSRWTFYKKCFFRWGTKKMLYIQNWWTIPLKSVRLSTFIYVVYNGLTLSTIFLNHFESESIYRDRPFKKCFFRWDMKKMLYIQNWWTIPFNVTLKDLKQHLEDSEGDLIYLYVQTSLNWFVYNIYNDNNDNNT